MAFGGFNGGDKEHAKFEPLPVDQYPNHQTENGVTLASLPYETKQQAEPAFGKVNPYEYGVLPILLVIRNNSKAAIRVDRIHVQYMWPDRTKIDPTPPRDVKYIGAKAPRQEHPYAATHGHSACQQAETTVRRMGN